MQYISGPDFPTGGIIFGRSGILSAYKTGRGRLSLRAKANIEKREKGRDAIVISEIPFQVNKNNLLEKMAELVGQKKIEGISEIRDESDRDGMRIVIEVKRDGYPEVILNQLFKNTLMQSTFSIIMLALVNNEPKVLNLKQMMAHYVDHRLEVLIRRTKFDLKKAEERAHILEGLKIALANIDAVIAVIKKSRDQKSAKAALMSRFKLSDKQAQAILDMRLHQLTGLERAKIEEEYLGLIQTIEELKSILDSEHRQMQIIKDELNEIKKRFGDERRTEIVDEAGDFKLEDMVAQEDMVITISKAGYIKRLPVSTYKTQTRGGMGVAGMGMKEEDITQNMFIASTHSYILCFTNLGRCYWLKVFGIPQGGRTSKGKAIVNLLQLKSREAIAALVPTKDFEGDFYIIMATKNGVINKLGLKDFSHVRRDGVNTLSLDQGDDLIDARFSSSEGDIILGTKNGNAVRFKVEKLRQQGRNTRGVKGVTLEKGDQVVNMIIAREGIDILTVTENGYGKRTSLSEYRLTNRGGKGVINIKTTDRNGKVVAILPVFEDDEIMIMSTEGTIIRMPCKQISRIGRATQGVRLINLKSGHKVRDVTKVVVNPH
jgi:DNA gyrase subunit A